MTKFIICGQAPSRVGDGRPFTGPSGKRLAALGGFRDYEHLAAEVTLMNLFGSPQARSQAILCGRRSGKTVAQERAHAGDEFDTDLAAVEAFGVMLQWLKNKEERHIVMACGSKVFLAFTGQKVTMYRGVRMADNIEIWYFPHPSGASHYWNSKENRLRAANNFRKLLRRAGIVIAR
jgi:uracil-DNA glycosylase